MDEKKNIWCVLIFNSHCEKENLIHFDIFLKRETERYISGGEKSFSYVKLQLVVRE